MQDTRESTYIKNEQTTKLDNSTETLSATSNHNSESSTYKDMTL